MNKTLQDDTVKKVRRVSEGPEPNFPDSSDLTLLNVYVGAASLREAIQTERGIRLLWLEILVNDRLDWTSWLEYPQVREAYTKACRWRTAYKTLIGTLLPRATRLPADPGPIDFREFRLFAEALRFAATDC